MDEVFRNRFQSFEAQPPEYIWDRIKANIPGNNSGTLFSNPVSLASIAAIILIALMLGINTIKQENIQPANSIQKNQNIATSQDNTAYQNTNPVTIPAQSINTTDISLQNENPAGPQTGFGKSFPSLVSEEKPSARENIRVFTMGNLSSRKILAENDKPNIHADNQNLKPTYNSLSGNIQNYRARPELVMGVHFSPEVMFYPEDNINNQNSYRFDLSAALHFSDFFVETGLGLNFSKDQGGYSYDYQKYLGTYDDVYEVTFDSTENGVIPTYHTSPEDVYDSVSESYHPTKNKYTYLEIPLLIGFKKDYKRISWFVKGGPSFAFLVHKNIPEVNITDQDILLALNENKQPQRVSSNVQFVLGAGINYRIHKRVSLSFEPVFRYYLTSAYERSYIRSKHTYSAGVRAGLLFNF